MTLRERERESIAAFVQRAADEGYLSGRVLDYGCGRQPYRGIVEAAGGEYHGYDAPEFPGNVGGERHTPDWPHIFDAVLCTQVLQYVPEPRRTLLHMAHTPLLVLTYPTHWPEVEKEDLHRFTQAGMERLLADTGYEIIVHERRHTAALEGELLAIGYGVIARA